MLCRGLGPPGLPPRARCVANLAGPPLKPYDCPVAMQRPMDATSSERTAVARHVTGTSWAHRPWLLASLILIVTFVTYQSVWRAGFVWDDDHHFTNNPAMTAPHGLQMIWTS